jgi:adenylate cyclase
VAQAEVTRANLKPTENLQAYDWLLRAIGEERLQSREHHDRAIAFARRAFDLDPQFARAYESTDHNNCLDQVLWGK